MTFAHSIPVASKASLIRSVPRLLVKTAGDWMDNNALRLSAALAYYSVFSIAPLLVLSVGLAGWFFGTDAVRGHLEGQLQSLLGTGPAKAVQTMVQSTSEPAKSLTATIVGVVTLLIGASGVFAQLKDALNTIWGVKPKSGLGWRLFLRERLLSFGMVLVIGFLLLTSFLLTTLLTAFNHWMETMLQSPQWIWGSAAAVISVGVITLLFGLIFKVLPDVRIAWRHVWTGALATAILFEIGKFGLAYYLSRESTASSFGAAGSIVLLLLWVYYASCILLFGAEFTKVYAVADGASFEPSPLAEAITPEERANQGMEPCTVIEPPVETLAAIFPEPAPPPRPAFPKHRREILPYLEGNMVAGMLSALGLGLVIGTVSRLSTREAKLDPAREVRRNSRLLGAAITLLLSRTIRDGVRRAAISFSKRGSPSLYRWLRKI
ncbi:MAG: YihY/virulence factor BrkB family protein [Chthoniobacteraceae bacterium]